MQITALKVIKKINSFGYKAYIVGGYPRDFCLNRQSLDIDICTNATPMQLKTIFQDVVLPSVQYGGVTLIANKIRFEITTFRHEIKYENNRLPIKIRYINGLLEDLKRRDFTINTLCMDENGEIIDLLNGKKDINLKLIRMVGNPRYRLKEDCLRILRAIRFATILNFSLEGKLKRYIKKYGYLLKNLSYYRKKEELDKIFTSSNIKYGISLIKELELDKYLELSNLDKIVITSSLIGIWSQLDVLDLYCFNSNEKNLIKKINELNDKDIFNKHNLYNYGLYITTIVGELKGFDRKLITEKYNELAITNKSDILLTPIEISYVLNKKPNGYLKEIIDDLEHKLIDGELSNDKDSLSKYVLNTYK